MERNCKEQQESGKKDKNNEMDNNKKCAERSISEIRLLEVCETVRTNNRNILQRAPRCS